MKFQFHPNSPNGNSGMKVVKVVAVKSNPTAKMNARYFKYLSTRVPAEDFHQTQGRYLATNVLPKTQFASEWSH